MASAQSSLLLSVECWIRIPVVSCLFVLPCARMTTQPACPRMTSLAACCATLPAFAPPQALKHYSHAATLNPQCTLALANQAAALLNLKRWSDAVEAATQVRGAWAMWLARE